MEIETEPDGGIVGRCSTVKCTLHTMLCVCLLFAVVMEVGCGEKRSGTARVQGTVTIDGQPIPADATGNVLFRPGEGTTGRTAGASIVNGRYDCADAPVGKVKVFFSINKPTGRMITESDNRPFAEIGSIISQKYSSGIDAEITGDSSDQDFDLESRGN